MDGSFSAKDDDSNSSSSGYSGGGGSGGGFSGEHEEPACAAPENGGGSLAVPSFLHTVPAAESMLSPTTAAAAAQITAGASSSSSPQKRSGRRSVQKRVVSIPITEAEGSRAKGGGSDGGGAPPSDSWAWRKYGQKPIKGSPYPRGYYRCSSSKGCPARKQVERSRADPSMLVITYACEHNHPWPLPKNQQQQQQQQQKEGIHRRQPPAAAGSPSKPASAKQEPEAIVSPPPPATSSSPSSAGDGQIFAADLSLTMMADEFGWFSDVSTSPPAGDAFLGGPIGGDGALMIPPASDQEADDFTGSEGGAPPEEEEALFAGLGELPECAVVFRRGFLDRRIRMQIDGKDDRLVWRMREKDLEIERERERGCVAASR